MTTRADRPRWFDRPAAEPVDPARAAQLVVRLEGTAPRLDARLRGVDDAAAARPEEGGRWSVRRHVGHLGDLEPLWARRTRDLLGGRPELTPADLGNAVSHGAPHDAAATEALVARFHGRRAAWTAWLRSLAPGDFARSARHPRLDAPMTLADLLVFVAEHDDHHLAEIERVLGNAPGARTARALTADDVRAFESVDRAWIASSGGSEPRDLEQLRRLTGGAPVGAAVHGVEERGELVGVGAAIPGEDGAYEILAMATREDTRGRGVDAAVLRALVGHAARAGATRCALTTDRALPAAIRLYERFGFRRVDGPVPGAEHRRRGDVRMVLDLVDGTP